MPTFTNTSQSGLSRAVSSTPLSIALVIDTSQRVQPISKSLNQEELQDVPASGRHGDLGVFSTLPDAFRSLSILDGAPVNPFLPKSQLRTASRTSSHSVTLDEHRSLVGSTPDDIVYAIVDGIIGILNVMVGDLSNLNVSIASLAILREQRRRSPTDIAKNPFNSLLGVSAGEGTQQKMFAFLDDHCKRCRGVIINSEQSPNLRTEWEDMMRCSGTLPFMPIRRLVTWEEPFFHTPLDDVESAVWTGVWAALYSSKEWTVRESKWVDGLRSDNPDTLAGTKSLIIDLEDTNEDELSEPLKTLKPLFEEWLLIVREVSKKLRASLSDPADLPSDAEVQELCLSYFVKYLRQGVDFLRKRGVYDDVVGVDV